MFKWGTGKGATIGRTAGMLGGAVASLAGSALTI